MTFSSLFAERLKLTRKSLGWSQAEAAEISGVTREYWGRCERGVSMPGSEVLAALAARGVDTNYLLTGKEAYSVQLSGEESLMLQYYRDAPSAVRKAAMAALLSGVSSTAGQTMQNLSGGSHTMIGSNSGTYSLSSVPGKAARRKS